MRDESQLAKAWCSIYAGMPVLPQPALHPGSMEPVTREFLSVRFAMSLIMQGVSTVRWIQIREPVLGIYKLWRPAPRHSAVRLD